MIKIMLVDDHDIVRTGIRLILEQMAGVEIIAECADGHQAVLKAKDLKPDVVFMDVNMPGLSGLEATRRITEYSTDIRVIILTIHAENPFPKQLLDAGATGYLTKGCGADELGAALNKVYAGGRYIGTDIAQLMALSMLPGGDGGTPFDQLTNREMEVMMMIVQGKKAKEIGHILNINDKTVATYKYRVLEKLGIQNEVHLTRLAIRHGIVEGKELTL
ncbi:response regulator [Marinicella sp. W31]|uniref:response regulator n=1 Tax=Marinicella sp. W31 TaxID=3023713 RepID=UPI0037571F5B